MTDDRSRPLFRVYRLLISLHYGRLVSHHCIDSAGIPSLHFPDGNYPPQSLGTDLAMYLMSRGHRPLTQEPLSIIVVVDEKVKGKTPPRRQVRPQFLNPRAWMLE